MRLVVALVVLAVILGIIGLVITAVKWLLIIAAVLIALAVLKGLVSRTD